MKKKQQLIRIIAIVLVVLIVGGTVLSVMVSAFAETDVRDSYEMNIEYMKDEQALHITQRLVYHNRTGESLDRVVFYAAGNMFRRESALMYESDDLAAVFPDGFTPAGIDLQQVLVNGADVDWGYQGENEMYLRVGCALAPGESCVFEFDYYLLLGKNGAFIGEGDTDVRLSAFYFIPGVYDDYTSEFAFNPALPFTRWLYCDAADFNVQLVLPASYLPASTGTISSSESSGDSVVWRIEAQNAREFALSFGRRYREYTGCTDSNVTVRVLSNYRSSASDALDAAIALITLYEQWFGDFPVRQIDLVQSDYPLGALNFPGTVWLSSDLFEDATEMNRALRFCLAQQYIGLAAYPEPSADAWLSDALCEYIGYLAVEELQGYDAFLNELNAGVLASLRITIPGSLRVTSNAALFNASEYALIVRGRGAVVMHETRLAMGRETLIAGLRAFYELGLQTDVLTEMNLVEALDAVTDRSWEQFLTEWLFNVDEYIEQQIEWYE